MVSNESSGVLFFENVISHFFTDCDSMETAPSTWHLVKEVTAVVQDGLSQLSKG
jgi:hypothetical protein